MTPDLVLVGALHIKSVHIDRGVVDDVSWRSYGSLEHDR